MSSRGFRATPHPRSGARWPRSCLRRAVEEIQASPEGRTMIRRLLTALGASALLIAAVMPAGTMAADPFGPNRLSTPVRLTDASVLAKLNQSLVARSGRTQVVVRLAAKPVGKVAARTAAIQKKQFAAVKAQQAAVVARSKQLDQKGTLDAPAQRALNAIVVTVDRRQLLKLAADKRVVAINPVHDYQLDLSETHPYIGGAALPPAGGRRPGGRDP